VKLLMLHCRIGNASFSSAEKNLRALLPRQSGVDLSVRTKVKIVAVNPFYSLNYKPSLSSFYATNHRLSPFHGDLIHQNCGGPGGLADSSGIVGGPALKRQPLAWFNGFVSTWSKTHVCQPFPFSRSDERE
jgi:hypothetical protein